jgi:hypothetical protein
VAPACAARLPALQAEITRAAEQLTRVMPADQLFPLGAPNEVARVRLAPLIEAIVLGDAGAPAAHDFDCRGLVCRLCVLGPTEGESANRWMLPLQTSAELRRHQRRGVQLAGGAFVRDAITGQGMRRRCAYLSLARADGAPAGEAGDAR